MSKKYIRDVTTFRKKKKPRLEVQTELLEAPPISPKMAARLHKDQMPSLSFLEAPLKTVSTKNWNDYFSDDDTTFGVEQHEAFVRNAYMDLSNVIHDSYLNSDHHTYLAIVRGSSGVGKSVFLAYFLARLRYNDYKNFALFHAPKSATKKNGEVKEECVLCSIWINGEKVVDGEFQYKRQEIHSQNLMKKVEVVIMDGCSMSFSLGHYGFRGLIVLSASPSQFFQNLTDAYPDRNAHGEYNMPPVSYDEALEIGKKLIVREDIVTENYQYMNGILRYLFKEGAAKFAVTQNVKK